MEGRGMQRPRVVFNLRERRSGAAYTSPSTPVVVAPGDERPHESQPRSIWNGEPPRNVGDDAFPGMVPSPWYGGPSQPPLEYSPWYGTLEGPPEFRFEAPQPPSPTSSTGTNTAGLIAERLRAAQQRMNQVAESRAAHLQEMEQFLAVSPDYTASQMQQQPSPADPGQEWEAAWPVDNTSPPYWGPGEGLSPVSLGLLAATAPASWWEEQSRQRGLLAQQHQPNAHSTPMQPLVSQPSAAMLPPVHPASPQPSGMPPWWSPPQSEGPRSASRHPRPLQGVPVPPMQQPFPPGFGSPMGGNPVQASPPLEQLRLQPRSMGEVASSPLEFMSPNLESQDHSSNGNPQFVVEPALRVHGTGQGGIACTEPGDGPQQSVTPMQQQQQHPALSVSASAIEEEAETATEPSQVLTEEASSVLPVLQELTEKLHESTKRMEDKESAKQMPNTVLPDEGKDLATNVSPRASGSAQQGDIDERPQHLVEDHTKDEEEPGKRPEQNQRTGLQSISPEGRAAIREEQHTVDEASFESVYVKLSTIQMPGSGRSSFSPVAVKDSELEGRVEKHKKTMSCTKVSPTKNADFEQCERPAIGREEPLMEATRVTNPLLVSGPWRVPQGPPPELPWPHPEPIEAMEAIKRFSKSAFLNATLQPAASPEGPSNIPSADAKPDPRQGFNAEVEGEVVGRRVDGVLHGSGSGSNQKLLEAMQPRAPEKAMDLQAGPSDMSKHESISEDVPRDRTPQESARQQLTVGRALQVLGIQLEGNDFDPSVSGPPGIALDVLTQPKPSCGLRASYDAARAKEIQAVNFILKEKAVQARMAQAAVLERLRDVETQLYDLAHQPAVESREPPLLDEPPRKAAWLAGTVPRATSKNVRAHEPPIRPRKFDTAASLDTEGAVAFKAAILNGLERKLRLKLGLLVFAHNRAEALDRTRLVEHSENRAATRFQRSSLHALAEAVEGKRGFEEKAVAMAMARSSRWMARALRVTFESWRNAATAKIWRSRQLWKGLVRYRLALLGAALTHWVVAVRSARLSRLQGAAAAAWACLWIKRRAIAAWRSHTITAKSVKTGLQQQQTGSRVTGRLTLPRKPTVAADLGQLREQFRAVRSKLAAMAKGIDHLQPLLRFRVLPPGHSGELLRTPLSERQARAMTEFTCRDSPAEPCRRLDMDTAASEAPAFASETFSSSSSGAEITLDVILPSESPVPVVQSRNPRGASKTLQLDVNWADVQAAANLVKRLREAEAEAAKWRKEANDGREAVLMAEADLLASKVDGGEKLAAAQDERTRLEAACRRLQQEVEALKSHAESKKAEYLQRSAEEDARQSDRLRAVGAVRAEEELQETHTRNARMAAQRAAQAKSAAREAARAEAEAKAMADKLEAEFVEARDMEAALRSQLDALLARSERRRGTRSIRGSARRAPAAGEIADLQRCLGEARAVADLCKGDMDAAARRHSEIKQNADSALAFAQQAHREAEGASSHALAAQQRVLLAAEAAAMTDALVAGPLEEYDNFHSSQANLKASWRALSADLEARQGELEEHEASLAAVTEHIQQLPTTLEELLEEPRKALKEAQEALRDIEGRLESTEAQRQRLEVQLSGVGAEIQSAAEAMVDIQGALRPAIEFPSSADSTPLAPHQDNLRQEPDVGTGAIVPACAPDSCRSSVTDGLLGAAAGGCGNQPESELSGHEADLGADQRRPTALDLLRTSKEDVTWSRSPIRNANSLDQTQPARNLKVWDRPSDTGVLSTRREQPLQIGGSSGGKQGKAEAEERGRSAFQLPGPPQRIGDSLDMSDHPLSVAGSSQLGVLLQPQEQTANLGRQEAHAGANTAHDPCPENSGHRQHHRLVMDASNDPRSVPLPLMTTSAVVNPPMLGAPEAGVNVAEGSLLSTRTSANASSVVIAPHVAGSLPTSVHHPAGLENWDTPDQSGSRGNTGHQTEQSVALEKHRDNDAAPEASDAINSSSRSLKQRPLFEKQRNRETSINCLEAFSNQGTSALEERSMQMSNASTPHQVMLHDQGTSFSDQLTLQDQETQISNLDMLQDQGASFSSQGTLQDQETRISKLDAFQDQCTSFSSRGTLQDQGTSMPSQEMLQDQGTSFSSRGTLQDQGTSMTSQEMLRDQGTSFSGRGTLQDQGTSMPSQEMLQDQGTSFSSRGTLQDQGTSMPSQEMLRDQGTSFSSQGTLQDQGTSMPSQEMLQDQGTSFSSRGTLQDQGTSMQTPMHDQATSVSTQSHSERGCVSIISARSSQEPESSTSSSAASCNPRTPIPLRDEDALALAIHGSESSHILGESTPSPQDEGISAPPPLVAAEEPLPSPGLSSIRNVNAEGNSSSSYSSDDARWYSGITSRGPAGPRPLAEALGAVPEGLDVVQVAVHISPSGELTPPAALRQPDTSTSSSSASAPQLHEELTPPPTGFTFTLSPLSTDSQSTPLGSEDDAGIGPTPVLSPRNPAADVGTSGAQSTVSAAGPASQTIQIIVAQQKAAISTEMEVGNEATLAGGALDSSSSLEILPSVTSVDKAELEHESNVGGTHSAIGEPQEEAQGGRQTKEARVAAIHKIVDRRQGLADAADTHYAVRLGATCFTSWRVSSGERQRAAEAVAASHWRRQLSIRAWTAWLRAIVRQMRLRGLEELLGNSIKRRRARTALLAWRSAAGRRARLRHCVRTVRGRQAFRLLEAWQRVAAAASAARRVLGQADGFASRCTQRRALRKWIAFSDRVRLLSRVFAAAQEAWESRTPHAEQYAIATAAFCRWRKWLQEQAKARDEAVAKAVAVVHRGLVLKSRAWQQWMEAAEEGRMRDAEAARLRAAFRCWRRRSSASALRPGRVRARKALRRSGFCGAEAGVRRWRLLDTGFRGLHGGTEAPKRLADTHRTSRLMEQWASVAFEQSSARERFQRRWEPLREARALDLSFLAWAQVVAQERRHRLLDSAASEWRQEYVISGALAAWRLRAEEQHVKRALCEVARSHFERELLRRALYSWAASVRCPDCSDSHEGVAETIAGHASEGCLQAEPLQERILQANLAGGPCPPRPRAAAKGGPAAAVLAAPRRRTRGGRAGLRRAKSKGPPRCTGSGAFSSELVPGAGQALERGEATLSGQEAARAALRRYHAVRRAFQTWKLLVRQSRWRLEGEGRSRPVRLVVGRPPGLQMGNGRPAAGPGTELRLLVDRMRGIRAMHEGEGQPPIHQPAPHGIGRSPSQRRSVLEGRLASLHYRAGQSLLPDRFFLGPYGDDRGPLDRRADMGIDPLTVDCLNEIRTARAL